MMIDEDVCDLVLPQVSAGKNAECPDPMSELEEAVWGDSNINQGRFFKVLERRAAESNSEGYIDIKDGIELLYNRDGDLESEPQSYVIDRKGGPMWKEDDDFDVDIRSRKRLRKLRESQDEVMIGASEYEKRLRDQYERLHPTPEWARHSEEIDPKKSEDCYRLLRTSSSILRKNALHGLESGWLGVTRLNDVASPSDPPAAVSGMCFLEAYSILCVASDDRILRTYYVDEKENALFESIRFGKYPIYSVAAAPDCKEILIVGKQRHYYVLNTADRSVMRCDLAGFFASRMNRSHTIGSIPIKNCLYSRDNRYIAFIFSSSSLVLVHRGTKQIYTQLKVSDTVRSACFCPTGDYIYVLSVRGNVFKFELSSRTCVYKFADQGCLKARSIDVDTSGRFIAIGSSSGVVSIYREDLCSKTPSVELIKSVMNLTTSADIVKFNPFGQILAVASNAKKDSLKLINMSSLRVFPNWPTSSTPLGYIKSLAFSPDSRLLAIANSKGRIILYRLNVSRPYH